MEETKVGSFPRERKKMGLLGSGAGVMSPAEGCVQEAGREGGCSILTTIIMP